MGELCGRKGTVLRMSSFRTGKRGKEGALAAGKLGRRIRRKEAGRKHHVGTIAEEGMVAQIAPEGEEQEKKISGSLYGEKREGRYAYFTPPQREVNRSRELLGSSSSKKKKRRGHHGARDRITASAAGGERRGEKRDEQRAADRCAEFEKRTGKEICDPPFTLEKKKKNKKGPRGESSGGKRAADNAFSRCFEEKSFWRDSTEEEGRSKQIPSQMGGRRNVFR